MFISSYIIGYISINLEKIINLFQFSFNNSSHYDI